MAITQPSSGVGPTPGVAISEWYEPRRRTTVLKCENCGEEADLPDNMVEDMEPGSLKITHKCKPALEHDDKK